MKKLIAVLFVIGACGGGSSKPAVTNSKPAETTTEQSLPDAMKQMCGAYSRAKADPEWNTADGKLPIVGKHMEEGVTNPKALQFLEVVKGGGNANNAELDALLTEAAMKPEQCELRAVFAPAKP